MKNLAVAEQESLNEKSERVISAGEESNPLKKLPIE